ncbi:DUF4886 domain-containing protein [Roseomonas xinghualingensis]|uniref:DUF4886 domain-containing protein n=1 Tax=Roseomonas xinghualingensis TaxID=2986475 RepID=UPI0021F16DD0|nr:hypothetical protein [Roseomonas sp. SXEYE001]MCV4205990.1 hypothetical protein [Roseomonas sp. SXEYE001]
MPAFHAARRLALAAALILGAANMAQAQQARPSVQTLDERPASAIYIGNSFFYYNNSMHGHVTNLLRGAGESRPFRTSSVTISGSGFEWHDVESYFRPNAIGAYSFDADNNVVFNNNTARLFDIAIMMDCSQCPVHPRLGAVFTDYAKRHSDTVRRHGAKPVFFMSWAYADKPEMTAQLAEAYTRAGNDNNALVIPAGLAFARSIRERPDLNLYVADKRHPSLAGTYLAAATTYAAIFGASPEGNRYTAELDADTARFLQTVAWQTVRDYLGTRRAAN